MGPAVAKTAAKNAGVLNVTPTASNAVPVISPAPVSQAAVTVRPAAMTASAAAPSGRDGSRSGALANAMRPTTTMLPYTNSGMLLLARPTASARSAAKARNPPIASTEARNLRATGSALRWIRCAGGRGV